MGSSQLKFYSIALVVNTLSFANFLDFQLFNVSKMGQIIIKLSVENSDMPIKRPTTINI